MKTRLKKFEQFLVERETPRSTLNEASLQKVLQILKKDGITGKYPDEAKLAKAIHKNYKAITGEDYEDATSMSIDDTIADIMGYLKVDGGDFYEVWVDVIGESVDSLTEGASIQKIMKKHADVVKQMADVVSAWKSAKAAGDSGAVTKFLNELKTLTATKKKLEKDLNDAVMGTDKDTELSATFEGISHQASKRMESLVNQKDLETFMKSGRDIVNDLTDEGFDREDVREWLYLWKR